MFIYEKDWSLGKSFYTSFWIDDLYYPMHFHNNFEINFVSEGELELTLDNKSFTLKAGQAVVIFPKQLHMYIRAKHSRTCVIEFSSDMVSSFSKKYEGLLPEDNILPGLSVFKDKFLTKNLFTQKGILYEVFGMLTENTTFKKEIYSKDLQFLHKILLFVDENYMHDCSLEAASRALKYSYSYVSKKFTQYMKMSYAEYLNRYRVDRAATLLASNSEFSISRVCSECGFDSQCSFNRNFKKYAGKTPSELISTK